MKEKEEGFSKEMTTTTTTLALLGLLITIAAAAPTTTAVLVYAYEMVMIESNEGEDILLAEALRTIQNHVNSTNDRPYVILTDEGTLTVSYDNGTALDATDDIKFSVPHGYTPDNGYTYENSKVYKPDGTELFTE